MQWAEESVSVLYDSLILIQIVSNGLRQSTVGDISCPIAVNYIKCAIFIFNYSLFKRLASLKQILIAFLLYYPLQNWI